MDLNAFFHQHPKAGIAFSGGVDSSYLLYGAVKNGADVCAYYVKSAFQPQFELDDAVKLADHLQVRMRILEVDVLASTLVTANPSNRCYYCKRMIFSAISEAAAKDGFGLILDGTNASDREDERPGMQALKELKVLSPLRECGLTKEKIRDLSKEAGLFTWDKPAYACLATRIPEGEKITREKLAQTEAAEKDLFSLGFTDFRVRMLGKAAMLQFPEAQLEKVIGNREKIVAALKRYYSEVLLDMEVRN